MGGKSNDQGGRKLDTFRPNLHTYKSHAEQLSDTGAAGTDVLSIGWLRLTMKCEFQDSIFNTKLENIFIFMKILFFFIKK